MRSFVVFLCLVSTLLFAQQTRLETQLKEAVEGRKAEIEIAVIIDGRDAVTANNDIHYPLTSIFKLHQALALADHMGKQKQLLETRLPIRKSSLKSDTYSPLRDKYPQGGIEMSITDLLKYTLQQSGDNACNILFGYQEGPDTVNKYIHSLEIRECAIVGTEAAMHGDLSLCYENWTTPLAAAELVEIFHKKPLFPSVYKDFTFQTMVECQTRQNHLITPLLDKKVAVGHKAGTGGLNAKGQQIGCNDIGFVLLPGGHTCSTAVFMEDSEENSQASSRIIADISRIVYEYVIQH